MAGAVYGIYGNSRQEASRFFSSFEQQQAYGHDRLIACANMFDILPSSALPSDKPLDPELENATTNCRTILRQLPMGEERDSILGALGRIRHPSLKQKIRHRAKVIVERVENHFTDLSLVIDEAVNCRNHYVHGSKPRFDYNRNFQIVVFLTDTLEFVFAASDLLEAGWDIKTWTASGSTLSHPFASYLFDYKNRLKELVALLAA